MDRPPVFTSAKIVGHQKKYGVIYYKVRRPSRKRETFVNARELGFGAAAMEQYLLGVMNHNMIVKQEPGVRTRGGKKRLILLDNLQWITDVQHWCTDLNVCMNAIKEKKMRGTLGEWIDLKQTLCNVVKVVEKVVDRSNVNLSCPTCPTTSAARQIEDLVGELRATEKELEIQKRVDQELAVFNTSTRPTPAVMTPDGRPPAFQRKTDPEVAHVGQVQNSEEKLDDDDPVVVGHIRPRFEWEVTEQPPSFQNTDCGFEPEADYEPSEPGEVQVPCQTLPEVEVISQKPPDVQIISVSIRVRPTEAEQGDDDIQVLDVKPATKDDRCVTELIVTNAVRPILVESATDILVENRQDITEEAPSTTTIVQVRESTDETEGHHSSIPEVVFVCESGNTTLEECIPSTSNDEPQQTTVETPNVNKLVEVTSVSATPKIEKRGFHKFMPVNNRMLLRSCSRSASNRTLRNCLSLESARVNRKRKAHEFGNANQPSSGEANKPMDLIVKQEPDENMELLNMTPLDSPARSEIVSSWFNMDPTLFNMELSPRSIQVVDLCNDDDREVV